MKCSKYEYPILNINTKENKFDLGGKDLSDAKAIYISLDGSKPFGKVTVEFFAEVQFNGELVLDEESKKDIEELLKKAAQESPVHEQYEFIPSTSEGPCTGIACRKPD